MNGLFDKTQWLYERSADNKFRYILGEQGERPLVCIGVNPSTAEPDNLDPTLRNVKSWSKRLGFDGWIMLNLYPQRATDPNDLAKCNCPELSQHNCMQIAMALAGHKKVTVWAAWGTLINKRSYLPGCLGGIVRAIELFQPRWITIGPLSKAGHPHHPLYLSHISEVTDFDIESYLEKLEAK